MPFQPKSLDECLQDVNSVLHDPWFNGWDITKTRNVEQHLAYLTHAPRGHNFEDSSVQSHTAAEALAKIRQKRAYLTASQMRSPGYHELANLYYALMIGRSTLGCYDDSRQLRLFRGVAGMLQEQGRKHPRVLLLGFSTVYSLENLAALLDLNGLETADIMAFDKSSTPLRDAQLYCNEQLYDKTISYWQGEAQQLPFPDDSFDLIATHLFFTHIPDGEKRQVIREVHRTLKTDGFFVDQELLVPAHFEKEEYVRAFRGIAGRYLHSDDNRYIKKTIASLMIQFASHHHFFPYHTMLDIERDFEAENFPAELQFAESRPIYTSNNCLVHWDAFNIKSQK